jgi:hypothetical protein
MSNGLWAALPPEVPHATNNVTAFRPQSPRNTGELDRDAFLMLLITQMQHQDPLNPMDDRDFLAQMAQFSALEQQQHMTRAMELSQAHGMIGRMVYAHFFCDTAERFVEADGVVLSVTRRGGQIFLGVETAERTPMVDDDGERYTDEYGVPLYRVQVRVIDVPLERVTHTADDYLMSAQLQGILDGVANSRDIALIGRYVQAITFDANGIPNGFVEGEVEFVRFSGGKAIIMVNGREIFSDEIFSVSDNALVMGQQLSATHFVNGTFETVEGYIEGIRVNNNRAYVVIDGTSVRIDAIDHLVEALQFRGRHVRSGTFDGPVDRISVKAGGAIYMHSGLDMEISFIQFRENGGNQI